MPSVRVKRVPSTNYTTLQDIYTADDVAGRPRSRSVAQSPSAAGPSGAQLTDFPATASHGRHRSYTVDAGGTMASRRSQPLPRPPSKIYTHIMATPRLESAPFDGERRSRKGSVAAGERREQRPSGEQSDIISLHGSAENISYRGDLRHAGRIGSALGGTDLGEDHHHHDDIVEYLDVIDPGVATVSTLANAANAIVFPPLSFYSRKPTIVLPSAPSRSTLDQSEKGLLHEDDLDRHVQDCLSKRDKFRRIMRGVWTFMKTPMGIIVSIYGFLIVFWGAGIVLFLAKMINLHNANTQGYWVELCQQVETGLFTATSIGLIPFRVLDTWRMCWIYHWKRVTMRRRRKAELPDLYDNDDLPDPAYDSNYIHVLTEEEQADLHYQQYKFMESQTWYRPHGTSTHRAFPINLALWICILNDLNSFFQCLLSGCMWGLNRFERPAWTTATTLPLAFVAGILAGVFIWWGGKKTRRHEQVEQRLRAALAMERPPSIVIDEPSEDSSPKLPHGQLPESSATLTFPPSVSQRSPRRRDFVTEDIQGERDAEHEAATQRDYFDTEKASLRQRESVGSFGSVNISDRMTVPSAEHFEPSSRRTSSLAF